MEIDICCVSIYQLLEHFEKTLYFLGTLPVTEMLCPAIFDNGRNVFRGRTILSDVFCSSKRVRQ